MLPSAIYYFCNRQPDKTWYEAQEEIYAARGGNDNWRRRSSSSLLMCYYGAVDDWAAPPTSIEDLDPLLVLDDDDDDNEQQAAAPRPQLSSLSFSSARSLMRRASVRSGYDITSSPFLLQQRQQQPLNRVEEPIGRGDDNDDNSFDFIIRDDDEDEDYQHVKQKQMKKKKEATTTTPQTTKDDSNSSSISGGSSSSSWIWYAMGVIAMGVGTSVPFNAMMAIDPGSPLFVTFVNHIFAVVCNLHKVVPTMIKKKNGGGGGGFFNKTTLPIPHHVVCVLLGYSYNVLRADACTRLPPAVAMVLMNGRMLIGMTYDSLIWKTRYSTDQIVSAAIVTLGIVWSGISTSYAAAAAAKKHNNNDVDESSQQQQNHDVDYDGMSMLIGAGELLLGLTLVTILTTTVKIGFQRYGECPEEQVLFQHLFALPFFYYIPGQWDQIGPRLQEWTTTAITATDDEKGASSSSSSSIPMALLLGSNLILTMGHTHSLALFTARAPNMLLYQIVDTIKKFAIVIVTALGRAPPWPPTGFWGGSIVLVFGALRFLSVSQPPNEEEEDEVEQEKTTTTKYQPIDQDDAHMTEGETKKTK